MFKFIIFVLIFSSISTFASSGLEGKSASLTIELKSLVKTNEVLIVSGTFKSSEFATGLHFEPKNKNQ